MHPLNFIKEKIHYKQSWFVYSYMSPPFCGFVHKYVAVSFTAPNNPSAKVIHVRVDRDWLQGINANNLAHILGQCRNH